MAKTFSLNLTGAQEIPPNASAATGGTVPPNAPAAPGGTATITWDAATSILTYDIIVRGLSIGQVTGMQFHSGAAGATGPIAFGQLSPARISTSRRPYPYPTVPGKLRANGG